MTKKKTRKATEPRRGSWRVIAAIGFCVLLLAVGFFLAGRQHISSIEYGMKNSKLRKQVEDLESEKRRLILAREVSMSPGEIEKSARKVGMMLGLATAGVTPAQPILSTFKTSPQTSGTTPAAPPLVIKTASVSPVKSVPALNIDKSTRTTKHADGPAQAKKVTSAAE